MSGIIPVLTGNHSRNSQASPQGTLGARLHADLTGIRVPESDWVELIGAIAWRNQAALRTLYARSRWLVFTLALRITNNRELAQAVTLDVFHGVWQRAESYDPASGNVVAWIMSQTRARAMECLREEQRRKEIHGEGAERPAEPAPAAEDAKQLAAMARMSTMELQAIASFADLSYSEVAQQFGEPLSSVSWRVRSGLVRLRGLWRRQ